MKMLLRIAAQISILKSSGMRAVVRWGLLKLNVDLGILNVHLENVISHLLGSGILNVVLQIFSVICYTVIDYIRSGM